MQFISQHKKNHEQEHPHSLCTVACICYAMLCLGAIVLRVMWRVIQWILNPFLNSIFYAKMNPAETPENPLKVSIFYTVWVNSFTIKKLFIILTHMYRLHCQFVSLKNSRVDQSACMYCIDLYTKRIVNTVCGVFIRVVLTRSGKTQ
jgi:hypothetical protein